MQADRVTVWLNGETMAHPELAGPYSDLADLYHRKLWHQLTVKLEQLVPTLPRPHALSLYSHFVREFGAKINQLSLAKLASVVAPSSPTIADSLSIFSEIVERCSRHPNPTPAHTGARVLATCCSGVVHLASGDLVRARECLDSAGETLSGSSGSEGCVYHKYYSLKAGYHAARGEAEDPQFFEAALASIAHEGGPWASAGGVAEKREFARRLAIAALRSPDIWNFGELLGHPEVCRRLSVEEGGSADDARLLALVNAVNAGDVETVASVLSRDAGVNASVVLGKAQMIAVVELVFKRESGGRAVPFAELAAASRMPEEEVEMTVVRAIARGIVKGKIDHVLRVVNFSWVLPRVLNSSQIDAMANRTAVWATQISKPLMLMDEIQPSTA